MNNESGNRQQPQKQETVPQQCLTRCEKLENQNEIAKT
jgi:hypothetical protein